MTRKQRTPDLFDEPVFGTSEVGERAATRVRVVGDSFYAGRIGVIVKVYHLGHLFVRLGPGNGRGPVTLPFGASELQRV